MKTVWDSAIAGIAAMALLTACETAGGGAGGPAKKAASSDKGQAPAERTLSAQDLQFTSIGPNALPAESCGMILWTLEGDRPSAIMRYVVGEGAIVGVNNALLSFPLGERSGASQFGVNEWLAFVNERGMRMDIRVTFGLGFDGGVYLENGLITLEDAGGWRSVAPVAGIAGCR